MADEQVPARPETFSPKASAAIQSARAASVGLGSKGTDGKVETKDGAGGSAAAPIPLRAWLLNLGAQAVFVLAAALFLFVVLRLMGMQVRAGIVAAVILALVASSFVRGFIHWPLPKEALAAKPQLPPNIRPSESSGREVVETVVFVVVLVLLLKSFAAEAFVIPTGSMAETLFGYQKMVTCPSCGHTFPVNSSREDDPQDGPRLPTNGCTCPNCRLHIYLVDPKREGREPRPDEGIDSREILDPGSRSGDRVLVGKFFDFTRALRPQRLAVVVFKYPEGPQKNQVAMNYIKRLIGLPGETIAICGGNLYVLRPEKSPAYDDSHVPPKERWRLPNMHANDPRALQLFGEGNFEIIRKPPAVLLAMMRLVYDNDHQAIDKPGKDWQRWLPEGEAWEELDGTKAFRHGARAGASQVDWIHYRHRLRNHGGKESLITDFMGYNSGEHLVWDNLSQRWKDFKTGGEERGSVDANGLNWSGELILECEVQVEQAEGELVLQLVRGNEKFQATWDLSSDKGVCTLTRIARRRDGKVEPEKLDSQPTRLRKGKHRLRFANVDDRLTVWVDGELPFGDGVAYPVAHPEKVVPTAADLRPASIGVKGGSVSVRQIKLFRDTYHTIRPNLADVPELAQSTNPDDWKALKYMPLLTLYVQPGHYLCLGDNSLASSDGRSWGLVPERLMLGKALLVYFPFSRAGRIH